MKTKRTIKALHIFFALLLLVSAVFGGRCFLPAFADETQYTSALEDLQKDEIFNVDEYPENASDYSIKVIQIAESTDGELFIYTYQPCQGSRYLVATEINMALTKDLDEVIDVDDVIDTDDGYYTGYAGGGFGGGGGSGCSLDDDTVETYDLSNAATRTKLYDLTLLSSSNTLCKYKVNNFKVSDDKVRYYNITSICRKWDTKIDGVQTGDQIVEEKAYSVGQLWTVGTFGDSVVYDVEEVEVIKITDQMVGFRRYSEGFKFQGTYSCDSHFLAFSCDHAIDRLISADVSFYTRDYKAVQGSRTKYEGKVSHSVTLYDYEKAGTDSDGWFNGGDYVWDRMSSTDDYVTSLRAQGSSITNQEVKTITQYDWILCFYESEYKCDAGGKDVLISALVPFGFVWTIVNGCTTTGTIVSGVTLMRLEFEHQGTVYNMGVVSDKQTGSNKPIGGEFHPVTKFFSDLWKKIKDFFTGHSKWWVYLIVAVVVLVVGLPIIGALIPAVGKVLLSILKAIGKGLLWLLKGLWWLICAPFRGIAALIKKSKSGKSRGGSKRSQKKAKA